MQQLPCWRLGGPKQAHATIRKAIALVGFGGGDVDVDRERGQSATAAQRSCCGGEQPGHVCSRSAEAAGCRRVACRRGAACCGIVRRRRGAWFNIACGAACGASRSAARVGPQHRGGAAGVARVSQQRLQVRGAAGQLPHVHWQRRALCCLAVRRGLSADAAEGGRPVRPLLGRQLRILLRLR